MADGQGLAVGGERQGVVGSLEAGETARPLPRRGVPEADIAVARCGQRFAVRGKGEAKDLCLIGQGQRSLVLGGLAGTRRGRKQKKGREAQGGQGKASYQMDRRRPFWSAALFRRFLFFFC